MGKNDIESIEGVVARHIVETRFSDLPAEAVIATKEHVLHTLGTVLAGSGAPGCDALIALLQELGGKQEATVLGWDMRVPAHYAAMANSTMGHAQEFDNNDDRIAYKSSVCAVPGGLAIAERVGKTSGRDMLTAVCVGIDLGIRMGLSIQPQPAHPTAANLGPFASAASAAKLLGLDELQTWDALALALCGVATVGSSTTALSFTKRYHAGAASRNGVFAALLASKGFSARQEIFESPRGYFHGIHGREGDLSILTEELGKRFEVVNVGPKGYPSCRYTHGPVDGALAIVRAHDLQPDDVAEVRVTVGPRDNDCVFGGVEGLVVKQLPKSVVDGQFSIPFTVATAIVRRRLSLDDMTEAALKDADVLAVSQRVFPVVDRSYDDWPSDVKPCRVEIRTRNGQVHSERIEYPKGNPRNPVSHDEMRGNFLDFAGRAVRPLPKGNAERALDLIERLETVPDVREIAALLSGK